MARPREFDPEKALNQTMRIFWERGYQGTSLDELVKAAGVQKQSLYCAFGDKRSMFLKSLALYRSQVVSEVRGILNAPASPMAGIANLLQYASEPGRRKDCPAGCLMANTALEVSKNDPEVAEEVRKMFRDFERLLAAAVKKGQEAGEITTRFESAALGQSLANTINGIRILERTGASHHQVRAVVEMALAGMRA